MSWFTRTFLVQPLESIFFGPPRSFSAGEAHRAESVFPPSPFTFQGLVRSQLLRGTEPPLDLDDWSETARQERERLVGSPDTLPLGWQLQGPFPARVTAGADPDREAQVEPWVPTPRFLLGEPRRPWHARPVISTHPGLNDLNVNEAREPFLLCGRPEVEAVDKSLGGWIGPANLYFALVGEEQASWQPEQHHPNLPPFVEREHQPGLAIEPGTGTARFGLLYSLESLRFKGDAGLLGSFRGWLHERLSITALESATGNAGRKGRLVRFLGVERFHPAWEKLIEGKHLPAEVSESATFWLLAVTPVRLTDSCIPQVRFTAPWGVSYHVLAALTGHPITLGGYRMATGKSRPNRLYIPAGSAWLIRLEGGNPQDRSWFLRQLNNANSLGPGEEAAFGFGHTLVGLGPAATKENL